jgi:hypothetical protein
VLEDVTMVDGAREVCSVGVEAKEIVERRANVRLGTDDLRYEIEPVAA